jgi:hypothetical protein
MVGNKMKKQMKGAMVKFTYRKDPKRDPNLVFDLVKPVVGVDELGIKENIKYYAMKTGALNATPLTQAQYEEMINEATEQKASSTATEEKNQA